MENTNKTVTAFGQERAEQIWAQRDIQNNVRRVMTEGEQEYVRQVWQTMPGYTCWMDAFSSIKQGARLSPATLKRGDVLCIDGQREMTATVDEVGRLGVYIVTRDNCRIPFTFEELTSRRAEVVK